jgi:hypothetical protein
MSKDRSTLAVRTKPVLEQIISPFRLVVTFVAIAAAVWGARNFYERRQLSPFVMGTVRAGMPFTVVDNEARQEMGHGFACDPLGNRVRLCRLATDGPIGVLKILVDRSGRAAAIQFLVNDSSLRWVQKAREQAVEWNKVHKSEGARRELAGSVTRWVTDDRRWSAELARRQDQLPFEMVVADVDRLERIADANPSTLSRVANEGMIPPADLAEVEKYASGAITRAADSLSARAVALGRTASSLPACPPMPTDSIVPGEGLRRYMSAELAAVAEETVAKAYPGNRLVIGERKMYLVDAAGGAEEIRLDPNAQSGDNNIYAFAVTFPRRVAAANDAAKAFQPNARCRAPGEVILAHLDPTSRSVAEYTRVDVDPESLTGIIGALDFDQSAATPPALIAMYMGIYGDSSLYGQVHWNELIVVDPLKVLRRAPQTVSRSGPMESSWAALWFPRAIMTTMYMASGTSRAPLLVCRCWISPILWLRRDTSFSLPAQMGCRAAGPWSRSCSRNASFLALTARRLVHGNCGRVNRMRMRRLQTPARLGRHLRHGT